MDTIWYLVELALHLVTIYFCGAIIVVACSLITLFATFPNDMKDFDEKLHGIPTPQGKWFNITAIVLGLIFTYQFGIYIEL